ncbi:hypothetical protein K7432_009511 [Basidiobolus ranarum]|uniref:AB hydrolase-1 domain-containing protein n=1 Tax=Basidiobolus ranarum TaxID=34480 RepID=A0ABR2WQ81_9FUNG
MNNGTRVKVHYVREGPRDGQTVVLIHGYPQSWYEWRHQIPQLVKAGYQVVAFDTRGQGESSIPDEGYDGLTVATDLHLVLQSLNITKNMHVVGHDIGVWIGFAYVKEFAKEVSSFTVSGSPIPNEVFGDFSAYPRPGIFKWWHTFDFLMHPDTRSGINEEDFDEYVRILSRKNAFRAGNDYYRNFWKTVDIYKYKGYYKTPLTIPVLAVVDTVVGALIASTTKDYASNLTLQTYHGGHYIWEEVPKDTTKGLISFLSHV